MSWTCFRFVLPSGFCFAVDVTGCLEPPLVVVSLGDVVGLSLAVGVVVGEIAAFGNLLLGFFFCGAGVVRDDVGRLCFSVVVGLCLNFTMVLAVVVVAVLQRVISFIVD